MAELSAQVLTQFEAGLNEARGDLVSQLRELVRGVLPKEWVETHLPVFKRELETGGWLPGRTGHQALSRAGTGGSVQTDSDALGPPSVKKEPVEDAPMDETTPEEVTQMDEDVSSEEFTPAEEAAGYPVDSCEARNKFAATCQGDGLYPNCKEHF